LASTIRAQNDYHCGRSGQCGTTDIQLGLALERVQK